MEKVIELNPQEAVVLYNQQKRQFESLLQQTEIITAYLSDLRMTSLTLKEISGMKEGALFHVSLGSGTFLPVKLAEKSVKTDSGMNVFIEADAKKLSEQLAERAEKTKNILKQMREQTDKLASQLGSLENQLKQAIEKQGMKSD